NEDGVRVFDPVALEMRCRCSRERVVRVLRSFPRTEIESMKVDGRISVTCEFCNAGYDFDDAMLDTLYAT
ncbi:MAG: Hsp33 family molecular chaperone HslO, partial [Alphaproteobacteria bacterium]